MSFTFLPAPEEESLAELSSDTVQFAQWKLTPTAGKCYSNANETESCLDSQSGMMSQPSMGSRGADTSMRSVEDSPAKISAQPTQTQLEFLALVAAFGSSTLESLEKSNQAECSRRTLHFSRPGAWASSFKTWPKSGTLLNGVCFLPTKKERSTSEKGYSFLPTPTAHNAKEGAYPAEWTRNTRTLATYAGGKINPEWTEWLMGWPIGWTDLKPLGMDKFQSWLQEHGKRLNRE